MAHCSGVHPLRQLLATVVCWQVVDEMAELCAPHQVGYGICGSSEAAVQAAQQFLNNMGVYQAMVKLDYENAFNSVGGCFCACCSLPLTIQLCCSLQSFWG